MDPNPTSSRFQTTSWTLIVDARSNAADLESLLARYWSPVYAWLRRRGHDASSASDVTQSFLCDVVWQRNMIGKADPLRGRFRTYLLAALQRFEIDVYRREHGREGRPLKIRIPDDPAQLKTADPQETDDPGTAFDRQWATTIFKESLDRTEKACLENGMERHWRAYEARALRPALFGTQPTPNETLASELDARDAAEISSMVHSAKRLLRNHVKEVVVETIDDPDDLNRELAELRRFLQL